MLRTASPTRPRTLDDLLSGRLLAQVQRLDLASKKVFRGRIKGERRSKKRGESVEFADHRPYVVGDDLRFIDWNIYGRLDRMFLKLFMEEEDLTLHIVLDASLSMDCGDPGKFRYAQTLAAALGYVGMVNLNRVTLTAMGERAAPGTAGGDEEVDSGGVVGSIRNLRGRRRAREMGDWLCSLTPGGSTDFPEAARRLALSRTGKGVMVVVSDFFFKEGYEDALRTLVGRGYDVFCVQVLSPQEIDPTVGGDLRLKDVEDEDLAEVTITAPLLKRYKQNLAAYGAELRAFCARRDISLISVSSATPVETVLLDYMRARGLLR